jgi:S-adenosylmethionine-diacylglycerol 3-amino-3-carboxypropyl transferase
MPKTNWRDRIDQALFDAIYARSLVYNTCWEDPAVDRQALSLGPDDTLLVISSAGCNTLDYVLQAPKRIHAVDANPRQNALLELKIAAIRALEFDDFFAVFGEGFHPDFERLYRDRLRAHLSPFAQAWWDKRWRWFANRRTSFYFHGLSGLVARGVRAYFAARPRLREAMDDLFTAGDTGRQQAIYRERVAPLLWNSTVNWAISRQAVMSLLGVPYPQRKLVQAQHANGVAGFIREAAEYVFCQLPLRDNYFWRVYLQGRYDRDCCPEYLKRENFAALKSGLVDRIELHTTMITHFLDAHEEPITRFVLLDHMDWMSSYHPQALTEEWNAILRRATPGARILLRSAQERPAYLDAVRVAGGKYALRERLHFADDIAGRLQAHDRVHTYAGFVIADVPA